MGATTPPWRWAGRDDARGVQACAVERARQEPVRLHGGGGPPAGMQPPDGQEKTQAKEWCGKWKMPPPNPHDGAGRILVG